MNHVFTFLKKICISFAVLVFTISLPVLAYTDQEILDAAELVQNYHEGVKATDAQAWAAQVIKEIDAHFAINAEIRNKALGMCVTTYCGKGLREGLDIVKPELGGTGVTTSDSLIKVILGLIDFSLPFAGLFAFVGIVYGGFLYLTSFAEDQTEKAQNILIWSVLGLVIIFIAYPLVATLIKFQS